MTETTNITVPDDGLPQLVLSRNESVVLIVDLVESVRLMLANETGVIARWRWFAHRAGTETIPKHRGRVVKSLGDGLMAEFDEPRSAVQAAADLHKLLEETNHGVPAGEQMYLRAGLNGTHVYADDVDIYGSGVNLAARLATLAGPGETVVSASVRDGLTDGLDAIVDDLGECYMKHLDRPVRAYRLGPAGPHPVMTPCADYASTLEPAIAVIPFASRLPSAAESAIGDLIADGVISCLSHARHLRVVSRLSSATFSGRDSGLADVSRHLGVDFVLSGSYSSQGQRLLVSYELADARSLQVIIADRLKGSIDDLLQIDSEVVQTIATKAHDAILRVAAAKAQNQPLPTLNAHSLLLAGIRLLHRSARRDFDLSFAALSHLVDTHPRAIEPRVWLAKWYALRVVQGFAGDREQDTRAALACTGRALDLEPENAFALAMEGFVHCHLSRDYEAARSRLRESVAINPSETFGHLFGGVIHGLTGDFDAGLRDYRQAVATSPLDPAAYLLDSIGAYLHLGAQKHAEALALARQSLRRNRYHAHTWRILTVAQVETGDLESARASLRSLLAIQPGLTVASYLAGARVEDRTRRRFADAMAAAGLPAR